MSLVPFNLVIFRHTLFIYIYHIVVKQSLNHFDRFNGVQSTRASLSLKRKYWIDRLKVVWEFPILIYRCKSISCCLLLRPKYTWCQPTFYSHVSINHWSQWSQYYWQSLRGFSICTSRKIYCILVGASFQRQCKLWLITKWYWNSL